MRKILCLVLTTAFVFGMACAETAAYDSMTEACQFVRAQGKNGAEEIELSITGKAISGRSTGEIRDILTDALEYSAAYEIGFTKHGSELKIAISSEPRPALRMLHAWETGDPSALSAEEKSCLTRALHIANECRKDKTSALEIELAIFNKLCAELEYAYAAVAEGMGTPSYKRASTSIGALMDGKAQCQGYAEAFWLIGKLCGLDVETQYGWAGGGVSGKHAWNTIRLGTDIYTVDVCWGDVGGDSFEPDVPDYRYFNTALDRMPEGRRWHPEAEVAAISSTTIHGLSAFSGLQDDAVTVGSLHDAVAFALARYHAGMEYAHVFIPEQSITVSEAQDALMTAIQQEDASSKWGRLAHQFGGGTYIIVRWVLNSR